MLRLSVLLSLAALILFVFLAKAARTDEALNFTGDTVTVCDGALPLPTLASAKGCVQVAPETISLHRQRVWVGGTVGTPGQALSQGRPLALALSAKGSSEVFLNGQFVGSNGVVGASKADEDPGQLDVRLPLDATHLNAGENEVWLLMSGQRSWLGSTQSFLSFDIVPLRLGPNRNPIEYWIALTCFGAFLTGALYAGAVAYRGYQPQRFSILAGASALAALQLWAETLRSVWAYPYPIHDARLLVIAFSAMGVGLTLTMHIAEHFRIEHQRRWLAGLAILILIGMALISGFDRKISWALMVPALAMALMSAGSTLYSTRKKNIAAGTFLGFSALLAWNPQDVVDTYYYCLLLVVFVVLFLRQAAAFQEALRDHEQSELARRQLEAALNKRSDSESDYLLVKTNGGQERIFSKQITHISTAGDYVALHLVDGREVLHDATLVSLREQLPPSFISVHRSHLVNADMITELKRLPSGVGELTLTTGFSVPVSRRTMPTVRRAVKDLAYPPTPEVAAKS